MPHRGCRRYAAAKPGFAVYEFTTQPGEGALDRRARYQIGRHDQMQVGAVVRMSTVTAGGWQMKTLHGPASMRRPTSGSSISPGCATSYALDSQTRMLVQYGRRSSRRVNSGLARRQRLWPRDY